MLTNDGGIVKGLLSAIAFDLLLKFVMYILLRKINKLMNFLCKKWYYNTELHMYKRFQNKEVSPETHQRTFGFVSDVTFLGNIVSEFIFSGFSWTSFPFRFFSFRSLSRKLQIVSEWLNSWRCKSLIVIEFMERTKHGQFKMIWLTKSRRSEIHCIWFILY